MARGPFLTQMASSGSVPAGITTPWYSPVTGTCKKALSSVTYDIEYDAVLGTITSVNASAIVADIVGYGRTAVKQEFTVRWFERSNAFAKTRQAHRGGSYG